MAHPQTNENFVLLGLVILESFYSILLSKSNFNLGGSFDEICLKMDIFSAFLVISKFQIMTRAYSIKYLHLSPINSHSED